MCMGNSQGSNQEGAPISDSGGSRTVNSDPLLSQKQIILPRISDSAGSRTVNSDPSSHTTRRSHYLPLPQQEIILPPILDSSRYRSVNSSPWGENPARSQYPQSLEEQRIVSRSHYCQLPQEERARIYKFLKMLTEQDTFKEARTIQMSEILTELQRKFCLLASRRTGEELYHFVMSNRNAYGKYINRYNQVRWYEMGGGPNSQIMKDLQKKD